MRAFLLLSLAAIFPLTTSAATFDPATATNQAGLELFRLLANESSETNLVVSPYSIESSLALVYAGASGATRSELAAALHFPAENSDLSAGLTALRTQLGDSAQSSAGSPPVRSRKTGEAHPAVEWREASGLFGQEGYPFRPQFLTLIHDGFGARFQAMDFKTNAENARTQINAWVDAETQHKIHDLVPRGGLPASTRFILVNAIYLKAVWAEAFKERNTLPRPFHFSGDKTHDVPTMSGRFTRGYVVENGTTILSIPYLGAQFHLLIMMPATGRSVKDLLKTLTSDDLARWTKPGTPALPSAEIDLFLPKFRVEGITRSLGRTLQQLGIKRAFAETADSADFDAIVPRQSGDRLSLSEVFHQVFIEVDEKGTEAAAATGVKLTTFAIEANPPTPVQVHIDRPFLYAVQHRASGTCLFLGCIDDPH